MPSSPIDIRSSKFLGRNALTVVLYLEQDLIHGLAEPNGDTGGVSVSSDIREGFLTDSKQCRGPFGIDPRIIRLDDHVTTNSGSRPERIGLPLNRRDKTKVVQHAGRRSAATRCTTVMV